MLPDEMSGSLFSFKQPERSSSIRNSKLNILAGRLFTLLLLLRSRQLACLDVESAWGLEFWQLASCRQHGLSGLTYHDAARSKRSQHKIITIYDNLTLLLKDCTYISRYTYLHTIAKLFNVATRQFKKQKLLCIKV